MHQTLILVFFIGMCLLVMWRSRSGRHVQHFATSDRSNGTFCTGSKCSECQSGCCLNAICQPTTACHGGDYQHWWPKVVLDDGVPLLSCLAQTNIKPNDNPKPPVVEPPKPAVVDNPKGPVVVVDPPKPPAPAPQPQPQAQQSYDWKYGTMSYYNLGDYAQNDGWPGCTDCDGCFGGDDNSWLVALSVKGYNKSMCGKTIRLERTDNGKYVDVPIRDKMMAGDRNANDIDATPIVARSLGFNPTRNEYGPNKNIRWRFL